MPFDLSDPETKAALEAAVADAVEKATEGLKSKNSELISKQKTLKDQLTEHQTRETELEAKERQAREDALKKDGKVDELLESQKSTYQKLLDEQNDRNTTLLNTVRESRINESLTKAIAAKKGVPELLLPIMQGRIKFDETTLAIEVMNPDGTAMLTMDGRAASVDDLVSEYKANELYGRAFEAPSNSGGGSQGSRFSGQSGNENPFKAPEGGTVNMTKAMAYYSEMKSSGKEQIARQQAKDAGLNLPD